MANAGATAEGLDELRQAIQRFPETVTARLRAVAWRKSREAMDLAKSKVPVDTGFTRDHIHIIEDVANKQYIVNGGTDEPRVVFALHTSRRTGRTHTQRVTLNMLPNWLEYGTKFMTARPFMRPASDAINASYQSEMLAATTQAAEELTA